MMRRKKLWRSVAVGLCSVMFVSNISVYADGIVSDTETNISVEQELDKETEVSHTPTTEPESSIPTGEPESSDIGENVEEDLGKEEISKEEDLGKEEVSKEEDLDANKDSVEGDLGKEETSKEDNLQESPENLDENVSTDGWLPAKGEVQVNGKIDLSREDFELPEGAVWWDGDSVETFSMNDSSNLWVESYRYNYFAWGNSQGPNPGNVSCPGTAVAIKKIVGDGNIVDGEGKARLVYCMNFAKGSPTWHNMQFQGWANRKVGYAMFYGPMYEGQTSQWHAYSTGDWKKDYWLTQMAIHILNGEFTWEALWGAMFGQNTIGGATHNDKVLVMDRLRNLLADANNMANYGAFDGDGWIDLSKAEFSCDAPSESTSFYYNSNLGEYVLNGVFTPKLTMRGQDWHHRAKYMNVSTSAGRINHWNTTTMHQFALHIPKAEYEAAQRTGKDITVTVDVGLPKKWGGAIYGPTQTGSIQPISFLSFESGNDVVSFRKTFTYHIPRVNGRVGIQKRSGDGSLTNGNGNYSLAGAVYTVYKNSNLTGSVGTITTDSSGNGWLGDLPLGTYYIKETKASPGYNLDPKTYTVNAN